MWVFTHSMEYLQHHNYKLNSRYITCKSYMAMISYTIRLAKLKLASQELQGIICFTKKP